MKKILITDDCHPYLIDGLHQNGFQVDYYPGVPLQEVDDILCNYDGIIINTRVKMNKTRIQKGTKLEFIGRMGSGLDIIDLDYAKDKDIQVISTPEGNAQAVAEHSLALLLALFNKLALGAQQVKDAKWNREAVRGTQLSGKTVGIIGFGHTGPAFASVLSGFDVRIPVYDKYKEIKAERLGKAAIIPSTMEEVIKESDVISFNLPLTNETESMINADLIRQMKKGVIIINAARGKLVIMDDVIENIVSGQIGGCCFDVFPNEKAETYSLREQQQMTFLADQDNVIMTPHVAGWTFESKEKISTLLVEKIIQFYNIK